MVVLEEIEQARETLLKYTREAFLRLPRLMKPRILDIGCGSGVSTLELARLSDGEVIGIDTNQSCLDEFNRKIKAKGLSDRVKATNLSVFDMKFPEETFDVVWSEGVIGTLDFDKELNEWRRLLKHDGYLVIHNQQRCAADAVLNLHRYGYILADTVLLPADAWWTEFYEPLEEKIVVLLQKYGGDSDALKLLTQLQKEMNMVKKNPEAFKSAFYIMKKE